VIKVLSIILYVFMCMYVLIIGNVIYLLKLVGLELCVKLK